MKNLAFLGLGTTPFQTIRILNQSFNIFLSDLKTQASQQKNMPNIKTSFRLLKVNQQVNSNGEKKFQNKILNAHFYLFYVKV